MWPFFEQALTRYRELETQLGDPAVVGNRARYTRTAKEHGALAKQVKPYLEYKKVAGRPGPGRGAGVARRPTRRCSSTPSRSWPSCGAAARRCSRGWKISSWPRARRSTASSWKSGPAPAATRRPCSPATSTTCTPTTPATRAGRSRTSRSAPASRAATRKSSSASPATTPFSSLRYESGGHRVQRVPKTEQQGRIHTSAATVAVLPEPDEVQVEVSDQDIEWETMRAGGAGGQHVNKTESAVRIWYKKGTPDEMEVKCQDERSQHKNYDRAMRILRSRLYERQQQKLHKQRAEQRRTLIGSGDRSERIRTYNFPQNRVTDHRINLTLYKLDAIIAGDDGRADPGAARLRQEAEARRDGTAERVTRLAATRSEALEACAPLRVAANRRICGRIIAWSRPEQPWTIGRLLDWTTHYLAEKGVRDRRASTPRCCWRTPWAASASICTPATRTRRPDEERAKFKRAGAATGEGMSRRLSGRPQGVLLAGIRGQPRRADSAAGHRMRRRSSVCGWRRR